MERKVSRLVPVCIVLTLCCTSLLRGASAQGVSQSQYQQKGTAIQPAGLVWVDPTNDAAHTDGYVFSQTFKPQTFERVVYLKEPGQPEPKALYEHYRDVSVALGHTRKIVFINDFSATKQIRVVVVKIADGSTLDVGAPVMEQYTRDVKPDPRLYLNPEGYALSPDDRLALARIKLTYLSVPTKEEAEEVQQLFQPRWYVVDTRSGLVLRSYPGENPPASWY